MAYRVEVERSAQAALNRLSAADRKRVLLAIQEQLTHEPKRETRNRKPMRSSGPAEWELRVQPYRVFYNVSETAQSVQVVKVAHKARETACDVR